MTDYQGRTYMSPPVAKASNLMQEAGSQDCFIPKVCIHTWTGHTQGISVIRTFPETGHLLISGSMDTKIKVGLWRQLLSTQLTGFLALGYLHPWKLSQNIPWSR
jgi:hypothetical protein